MRSHLIFAAVAASLLLTSGAFAEEPGSGIKGGGSSTGHEQHRDGDRYTVATDDGELMCKVAGNSDSPGWAPPPEFANSIAHQREEGNTRCTPSMMGVH